jgi:hypothetical protein
MGSREKIRYPRDKDTELAALIARYLQPPRRHLMLLHANFLGLPGFEQGEFLDELSNDARTISDHDLEVLLSSEWRSNLTAAYLIAMSKRTRYRDELGQKLLASHLVYAAEGYCVALVRFGDEASASWLVRYLRTWLPQTSRRFDQTWAMACLIVADERLGSAHAQQFLIAGGLWETWQREPDHLDLSVATVRRVLSNIAR